MRLIPISTVFALMVCFQASTALGAIVIRIAESAGDVVFSYSGSLDISGLGQPISAVS